MWPSFGAARLPQGRLRSRAACSGMLRGAAAERPRLQAALGCRTRNALQRTGSSLQRPTWPSSTPHGCACGRPQWGPGLWPARLDGTPEIALRLIGPAAVEVPGQQGTPPAFLAPLKLAYGASNNELTTMGGLLCACAARGCPPQISIQCWLVQCL